MADSDQGAMQQCDDLAQPMGQVVGGGVFVPAFAGGFLAGAETGPGAIITGAAAGIGGYTEARDLVTDNWHDVVCQPLADLNASPTQVNPEVFAEPANPFTSPDAGPFAHAAESLNVMPTATIIDFGDSPGSSSSGFGSVGLDFTPDYSSSGGDYGGSSGSSDSGSSSSSD